VAIAQLSDHSSISINSSFTIPVSNPEKQRWFALQWNMEFSASRLKVERAEKHIGDLVEMVGAFTETDDFHSVRIEFDERQRTNHLRVDMLMSRFPGNHIALTIGDALHNLRSALDLLWYQVVLECNGNPGNWTTFPVRDTRQELAGVLKSALNLKRITIPVSNFVLNEIKSYRTGNPLIWSLNNLNIRDKHQLLVPVLQMMALTGLRLEDDKGLPLYHDHVWFMDESGNIRLREADNIKVTVKDKGRLTAAILFDFGVPPFESEGVVMTLSRFAEEITRTVAAFEALAPSCFVP